MIIREEVTPRGLTFLERSDSLRREAERGRKEGGPLGGNPAMGSRHPFRNGGV